jgi:shikimate dehydrogenase
VTGAADRLDPLAPGGRCGAAVLGRPISHSLSPTLHNAAYDALGLDDWKYRAVECDEDSLESTLRELEAEGMAGASLTMPLKQAVLPMLAGSDDVVAATDAANTVLFGPEPGWIGANTDVPGFVAVIERTGLDLPAADVWLIGAGATARSALVALSCCHIDSVTVVARRPEATAGLVEIAETLGVGLEVCGWDQIAGCADAGLVLSTTPAGATDILGDALHTVAGTWFDVVYSPWPTRAAAAWASAGGQTVGGLELLVEQAAVQVELMTGQPAPVEAMRAAGNRAIGVSGPG